MRDGPAPTYLDRPDYNYAGVTCPTCHFADGVSHTSRAAGVSYGNTGCISSGFPSPCCTGPETGTCPANQWNRMGHGWWDSRHAQSQNGWSSTAINYGWPQTTGPYGENDNTFCANCHSPLQASVYSIATVSESGTTATVTPAAPGIPLTDISVGDTIFLTGTASLAVPPVACTGYNNIATTSPPPAIGGWTVTLCARLHLDFYAAQITFTAATSGLATCYGGTLGDTTTVGPFYQGTVTNPVTVLSTGGNSGCTASGVPYACCTGSGKGLYRYDRCKCYRLYRRVVQLVPSEQQPRHSDPGAISHCGIGWRNGYARPRRESGPGILVGSGTPDSSGSYAASEKAFCLTCHEQDPHNAASNSVYAAMYAAGVSCWDCHMAPFTVNTGTSTDAPELRRGLRSDSTTGKSPKTYRTRAAHRVP